MKEFFDMNEPTVPASIIGSSLNAENERGRRAASKKTEKKNGRKVPRAVRELRDPDGLDVRDLLGL